MKTEIIQCSQPGSIERALLTLAQGGIVAFPTDTVYGLGANPFSAGTVEKLFIAKGRDSAKAIAVLLGEIDQLERMTGAFPPAARKLAERYWPGPLTLVVSRLADLPQNLSPLSTIGVRIPDHAWARTLLRCCGPLATTSANRSGGPNCTTAEQVLAQLDGEIDLLVDGGETPGGVPSSVVDCTGEELKVLRAGPITAEMVRAAAAD
jgi:L-threonylcarbamoyladenylate synthase